MPSSAKHRVGQSDATSASRAPTNLASLAQGIVRFAERQGIDREELLRSADIDATSLEQSDARIARSGHVALWRETERQLSDPDFGLKAVGSILSPESLGVVGLLAMTSATVGESIERSVRFGRVLKDDVDARMYTRDDLLVVELEASEPSPRPVADCSLAAFRHFMETWSGETIPVRHVSFRHDEPASKLDYERVFGCPVSFGQPTDRIVFARAITEIPLITAQPEVATYLERVAASKLLELAGGADAARDLPSEVAAAVRDAIEGGDARITTVARRLGTSARSLQRALGTRGLEYRRIVDEIRWSLAAPLVATTDVPIERIAERLGYADAKAFRRAFRRWTGSSPNAIRRAHREAAPLDGAAPASGATQADDAAPAGATAQAEPDGG